MKQMYLQLSVAVLWLLVFTYLSFWGKKNKTCSSVALIVSEVLSIYTKITYAPEFMAATETTAVMQWLPPSTHRS